ncbi:MAG: L,D-transpeptidase [Cocleimonas sp.]
MPQPLFTQLINELQNHYSYKASKPLIIVSAYEQTLFLIRNKKALKTYKISTASAGLGNQSGSYKTPLGVHQIVKKFGDNAELGSIFKGRENTGKIAKILQKSNERSESDNITTRILWLSGLQNGVNKGEGIDSHKRYIYIHGTDEEGRLGQPASHGCIRMANKDVVELFNKVENGTLVNIIEQ